MLQPGKLNFFFINKIRKDWLVWERNCKRGKKVIQIKLKRCHSLTRKIKIVMIYQDFARKSMAGTGREAGVSALLGEGNKIKT